MAKTTITLDKGERDVLRLALIEQILCETERLDKALVSKETERDLKSARESLQRLRRIGILLDRTGWKAKQASAEMKINFDRDLPLAIYALRDRQRCEHDGARDAYAHDDAEYRRSATDALGVATRALLRVEGIAIKLGRDAYDWPGRPKR